MILTAHPVLGGALNLIFWAHLSVGPANNHYDNRSLFRIVFILFTCEVANSANSNHGILILLHFCSWCHHLWIT
uniref:Uncharacterized protein n=1 Tax=Leersia perrieri TaxID=77586 RepID=A0A0D9X7P0_9ORYZ